MYKPAVPNLPQGLPRHVPPNVPSQPLWQGAQLRRHLAELLQTASLLSAVGEELKAIEILKSKGADISASSQTETKNLQDLKHEIEPLANLDINKESNHGAQEVPTPSATASEVKVLQEEGVGTLSSPLKTSLQSQIETESVSAYVQNTIPNVTEPSFIGGQGRSLSDTVTHHGLLATVCQERGINESQAREAAIDLQRQVQALLAPLQAALRNQGGWENVAAVRLGNQQRKICRNRRWRQRRRQRAGEALLKEREGYEKADQKADEWRAREIAKLIARRKMDKMKEVAEKKAKEERKRLEKEQETVLMVEKLQELRTLRIQKLKKQGRFFPDEDDKFMERVRAAVEEEERQAAAAADTSAAAAAIASAQEAGKSAGPPSAVVAGLVDREGGAEAVGLDLKSKATIDTGVSVPVADSLKGMVESSRVPNALLRKEVVENVEGEGAKEDRGGGVQDGHGGLPAELYHYYYGSQADMGTLIEVRRAWDAFIMPSGSRIPGHWIGAPPPSDAVLGLLFSISQKQETAYR